MSLINSNLQRTIRQVLYQLKHLYGAEVDVYKRTSENTDFRTGVKTQTLSKVHVPLAIVMPADAVRKFFQGISFISESKPFVSQGTGWDQDTRGFIFDGQDMQNYQWELEDWIVRDGEKYEVSTIEALEYKTGWLVMAKRIRGSEPVQIIEVNVVDTLGLTDSVEQE